MDGFALRSADVTTASPDNAVRLTIVGQTDAGEAFEGDVRPGESVRVSTGAAIPPGCDAVIPSELVSEVNGDIVVAEAVEQNRHVRFQGEDIRAGQRAVTAGATLRSQELALLASTGRTSVLATPAPVVSIVSIGPELFEDARPYPVYDANGPMLAAQARSKGASILHVERSTGDLPHLANRLAELAAVSQLILTSGGVSNSHADSLAELLDASPDAELWNVRLRPGKHYGFGFIGACPLLALPGNPVAAFVGFELLGSAAIARLAGKSDSVRLTTAKTSEPLTGDLGRTDAIRGFFSVDENGQQWVRPTANRGSGAVSTLFEANCIILLPESVASVASGAAVEILPVGYQ